MTDLLTLVVPVLLLGAMVSSFAYAVGVFKRVTEVTSLN